MKKKLLALVLAAAMTLSLASCGGSKTETPSTGSDNSSATSFVQKSYHWLQFLRRGRHL